jgi:hypothetical protein
VNFHLGEHRMPAVNRSTPPADHVTLPAPAQASPLVAPASAPAVADAEYPTELLTAAWFGCSQRKLYELRRAGKIPFMRSGHEIRYRRADYPLIEQAMMHGVRSASSRRAG